MDETKAQRTELHELPEGDLDLDLADLDLDIPDLDADPHLPVVEDHTGSDLGDMSDLDAEPFGGDLDLDVETSAHSDSMAEPSMDWELPPQASDDVLDLDDSGTSGGVGGVDPLAPDDEDDLQPVALSESELETILGSSGDDPLGGPIAEFDDTLEAPSISGDFEELSTDESDLEVTDADLALDDASDGHAARADSVEHEELTPVGDGPDLDLDFDAPDDMVVAAFPDDDEDSEPVTLSEDELGSILDDVEPTDVVVEGISPPDEMATGAMAPMDSSAYEEDITLSDEELNQVLLEGDLGGASGVSTPAAGAPSLLDDEDEEPITLTAEELGNIVADVETVGEKDPGALGAPPPGPSIFDNDDDEGPVALSEHELEAILEDVDDGDSISGAPVVALIDNEYEVTDAGAGDEHVIVLDDYEDEVVEAGAAAAGAAVSSRERSPVIEQAAEGAGVDKGDLKKMISYLDGLFEQLPDSTVEEFSRSEYYDLYKKIMSELGIGG